MSPSVSVRLLLTQSDARLVAFAQAGNERAFEALVKRYRRPLLGYCRRLLLSEERAEDALQQALLQAWLALRAGTEVDDVKPWLYRIVHNSALNVLRVSGYDYCKLSESLSGADAPEADLDRRIAVREALAGLAALPEMQREALLRTAVEGRTHQQVAKDLGLSENALRGLVYRARATMRAAAGAITPSPLVAWALTSGGRGTPIAERLAEISAGGGSAGLAGLVVKGSAVAITAGALAGGIVAGHSHPHAAKHLRPHTARPVRSVSRPTAVSTTQSSTWTPVAHTPRSRHEEQPSYGERRSVRRDPPRPRHIVRQPGSVVPIPAAAIKPPPVPVPVAANEPKSTNEPKSKDNRGSSEGIGGDPRETHDQGSNEPTVGESAAGGHYTADHAVPQGQQSSGGNGESSRHSGKGKDSSPGESGNGSGENGNGNESRSGSENRNGSRSVNGSRKRNENSPEGKGSFSPDNRQGGDSSDPGHGNATTDTGGPGESPDHRGSSGASSSTRTNSSSKDVHGSTFQKGKED